MRIRSITSSYYRLPLPEVGDAGHGRLTHEELVLVEVTVDELPQAGLGYAYTIGRGGHAIEALIQHDLAPLLIGQEIGDPTATWRRLWSSMLYVGRGGLASFAIAALDIALWDLRGLEEGQPLYRLFGGESRPIPAYGSGVDLPLPLDDLLRQVEGFLDRGFRAVKIKVGRPEPAEDEARIAAVRQLIGDDVDLMVDANMSWTAEEAIERGRRLEPYRLRWLEEPTIPEDVAGHARIAAELDVPVALGESLHSPWEFERYLAEQAVEIVQLDPITLGGITPWLRVSRAAAERDLPLSSHYTDELSAHLLTACHWPLYLEKHAFALDPYLEEPQAVVDGCVRPFERPGHGLRFSKMALGPFNET
jgi:L-alanine-DL-glutamate epimerase-like enolase superfamily enzyme